MTREDLGRFMVRVGPEPPRTAKRWRDAITGEGQGPRILKANRACGYILGALDVARQDFANALGMTFEWPDPEKAQDADEESPGQDGWAGYGLE
jgi:hypothetical protein